MFEGEPMAPSTWLALHPLTDQPKWDVKWGIVSWIVRLGEGGWLGGPELAKVTDTARARVHLDELAAAGVIERDGGGGNRKFWVRVNPRWWDWRVRWHHRCKAHDKTAAGCLADCNACRGGVEQWTLRAADEERESPVDRFIARPVARYGAVIARLGARYSNDSKAHKALQLALSRAQARDNRMLGADPQALSRAWARDKDVISRAQARDKSSPHEEEEISNCSADETSSSSTPAPPPAPVINIASTRNRRLTPDEERARSAVLARCAGQGGRRPFLKGWPAEQLYELVDRYGAQEVVDAAQQIPSGVELPPRFVELLADVLAAGTEAPVGRPDRQQPTIDPPLVLDEPPSLPEPSPESLAGQLARRADLQRSAAVG